MRALQAALLLAAAAMVSAAGVAPSLTAPGGLTREQTPQFVLLTHDDGVDAEARKALLKFTKGREAADGCPVTATVFTLMDPEGWTVCEEVMKMYDGGFEIADHTIKHETLAGMTREQVEAEIAGAREKLVECSVPEEDVVGLRTPYLNHDSQVREVLHSLGFLYDASIIEDHTYSFSKGFANRVWPFDLGNGNPLNCSLADLAQETISQCSKNESFPGLWEVPVWRLDNKTAGAKPYAMDYGYSYETEAMNDTTPVFDILKAHFDLARAGNRAPFPIFGHVYYWNEKDNSEQIQKFIDYTLQFPEVRYVTIRQLLAWMQNPLPLEELTPEALGCGNAGGAPGTLADASQRRRTLRGLQL